MALRKSNTEGTLSARALDLDLDSRAGRKSDPVLDELLELIQQSKSANQTMGIPWQSLNVSSREKAMTTIRRVANKNGLGVVVRAVEDDDSLVAFKGKEKRDYSTI